MTSQFLSSSRPKVKQLLKKHAARSISTVPTPSSLPTNTRLLCINAFFRSTTACSVQRQQCNNIRAGIDAGPSSISRAFSTLSSSSSSQQQQHLMERTPIQFTASQFWQVVLGSFLALMTSISVSFAFPEFDHQHARRGTATTTTMIDGGGDSDDDPTEQQQQRQQKPRPLATSHATAAIASVGGANHHHATNRSNNGGNGSAAGNITIQKNPQNNLKSSSSSSSSSSTTSNNPKFRKPLDVSVRAIRGGRWTMEDEYYIGNGGRFAAVFDGHGGSGVSQYLKRTLYNALQDALQQKHWEERDDDDDDDIDGHHHTTDHQHQQHTTTMTDSTPSVSCYVSALRAAFEQVEADVMKERELEYVGSTAVAVVVHENAQGARTLLSANVGDSRAVLCRNGKAVDLTRDHKPNDPREKARIMRMGEIIEWDQECKVHRVRSLSLARAIGDGYAKPVVSSEVEIQHFPVRENGVDEFIVLASDGLWDVMSSQDAVTYVKREMEKELSKTRPDNYESYKLVLKKNMAKFLAREAIRKGSQDNVTVVLVWL